MASKALASLCLCALFAGCRVFDPPEYTAKRTVTLLQNTGNYDLLSDIQELSLGRAVDISLQNNPDYRAAFLAVDAARMAYYQTLAAYLPEVSGNGVISQSLTKSTGLVNPPDTVVPYDNNFSGSIGLRAGYLVFDGFARELNMLAAKQEELSQEDIRLNVERLLRRSVSYAYWDVLLAKAQQEIAAGDIVYQNSNLAQAEVRYRAGHISKSEFLNFKIMLIDAQALLTKANEQYNIAVYALACLMGYPSGTLPESLTFPLLAPDGASPLLAPDACINLALENRPDLAALSRRIRILQFQKWSKLSDYLPRLNAFAGTSYSPNLSNYSGYSLEHRGWNSTEFTYGGELNWLLFDGLRSYNQFRQYQELEHQALLSLDSAALRAINEVRIGFEHLQTAHALVEYYRENLGYITEQRNLVTVEYWAGNVTITRLNEAQNELVNAQSKLAIELAQLRKSAAQLAAAANVDIGLILQDGR
ncbi:MAG: TolC family protein [Victivallaceae bacterium]|nr:TolC family protein [Victivallaceae bacterium]